MKNLKIPPRNSMFYDKIVNAKTDAALKRRLEVLAPAIKNSYKEYCKKGRSNELHLYNASAFRAPDHSRLRECYGDETEVIALKKYIRDKQAPHLRFVCQYCMVGISDTFDHYLPQGMFPEFSVLANNLIPACDHCNRKKWANWKNVLDERLIINFYYDSLPSQQFLTCRVIFRGNVPKVIFSLQNLAGIPNDIYDLIVRHFDKLGTIERIHSVCDTELEKLMIQLKNLVTSKTLLQASTFLLNESNDLKGRFGRNYYLAVLYDALANSNRFLQLLGFK